MHFFPRNMLHKNIPVKFLNMVVAYVLKKYNYIYVMKFNSNYHQKEK